MAKEAKPVNSLKERLMKNSTLEFTETVTDSPLFNKQDMIMTSVPMINVALSGSIDGGIMPGLTLLAGPSKHFKSGFALLMMKSFFTKYPEGIVLFYVSEFGTPLDYFKTFNLPLDQVIYSPITDIEELKFDIMKQLKELKRGDQIMIVIDSIGNLASKKEVEDAIAENGAQDMSRPKAVKSLFRMVTPHLTLKSIPLIVVNHTYKTQEKFPKDVVSGGTGSYYSADNIWVIGRQQDKDDKTKTIDGYHFIINIEKSRYVREKSKIPISVSFDGGINFWSGLLEVALEGGYVAKPKQGYYSPVDRTTGVISETEIYKEDEIINNGKFWKHMFATTDFASYIESQYKMASGQIMGEDN